MTSDEAGLIIKVVIGMCNKLVLIYDKGAIDKILQ